LHKVLYVIYGRPSVLYVIYGGPGLYWSFSGHYHLVIFFALIRLIVALVIFAA